MLSQVTETHRKSVSEECMKNRMLKNKNPKVNTHTHVHIWDIPNRYFLRNTKAKIYRTDVLRLVESLAYTNKLIQYSSMIAIFNIKAIYQHKNYVARSSETFGRIEEFVYHYENYCYRAFTFREKTLQFLNAILQIGYTEKQVKIEHIVINPIVRQAAIVPLIEKFSKPTTALCKLISDRHQLTHRIYYGGKFDYFLRPNQNVNQASFKAWLKDWEKEISRRALQVGSAEYEVSEICNHLARKIMIYKDAIFTSVRGRSKSEAKR